LRPVGGPIELLRLPEHDPLLLDAVPLSLLSGPDRNLLGATPSPQVPLEPLPLTGGADRGGISRLPQKFLGPPTGLNRRLPPLPLAPFPRPARRDGNRSVQRGWSPDVAIPKGSKREAWRPQRRAAASTSDGTHRWMMSAEERAASTGIHRFNHGIKQRTLVPWI